MPRIQIIQKWHRPNPSKSKDLRGHKKGKVDDTGYNCEAANCLSNPHPTHCGPVKAIARGGACVTGSWTHTRKPTSQEAPENLWAPHWKTCLNQPQMRKKESVGKGWLQCVSGTHYFFHGCL